MYLSHTITDINGASRLTGVTVSEVDGQLRPIPGTEKEYACDTLILSVGLIPENELTVDAGIPLDPKTRGADVDEYHQTEREGFFAAGNVLHGVGTSVKHFAANNQETRRMSISDVVDERTLREIYLSAFEQVVKDAKPWTLMCSYNRINGTYSCENEWLLSQVLRKEWGFDGIVMSDWGAMDDRCKSLEAGCELEMPASHALGW